MLLDKIVQKIGSPKQIKLCSYRVGTNLENSCYLNSVRKSQYRIYRNRFGIEKGGLK